MRMLLRVLVLAAGLMAGTLPALAQDGLEAAKASGQVGERPNGLVGAVPGSVPPDIAALIERVNAQRLDRYKEVARSNGISLDKVQAVAGQQLIERTPPGQFVMLPNGTWVLK